MLDDSSFYTFIPSLQNQEANLHLSKQRRKTSALEQPPDNVVANAAFAGVNGENLPSLGEDSNGPPKATLTRRAQSYTDFHRAARSVLKAHSKEGLGREPVQIKNEVEFGEWYDGLEEELLEASHEKFKTHLEELKNTESYLDKISRDTTTTLDLLSTLSRSFKSVETQTTAFQKQCEDLLVEQKRLEKLADNIGENLQYYSFLEPITRKLNAPGAGNFVRGKEFSDMLARLDECLEYMNSHQSQREAPIYRSRYRLLLTRGLTLIRVHFVAALRDIAADVTKRIADKQLNDTTMSALLYAKFRVGASELKEVAQEIRKRAVLPENAEPGAEAEYQSLMNELYAGYSSTRGKLILPLITKRIGEIAMAPSSSKDLVTFARTSIGYMKGMCADEFDLWREWFEGHDSLFDFLEAVCEPLYDHLRPRIIRETQILKLCELCTLLQTRYFKDPEEEPELVDPNQLDFGSLILPALEDAQTRLVFRAQAILRDDIENFKPKPEDLDYPARNGSSSLSGVVSNGPATSGRKNSISEALPKDPVIVDDGEGGKFDFNLDVSFQGWYPTLRKAIWLLSRIYRLVNSTVFDDLAHQIVHQTTLSLQRGSLALITRTSQIDGQLFLLKHLLLLKQQIVAFDIEYVTPDVSFDFSGLASTFYELRDRGGLFDPRALWHLISNPTGTLLPRVVENMLDAKVELDGQLRTVINDFCSSASGRITASISPLALEKKTFDPAAVVPIIQAAAKTEVPLLRKKLEQYLEDSRTRETLAGAVQDQVVLTYENWYEGRVADKKRAVGAPPSPAPSRKGKGREDEVWDAGVFAEWAMGTFRVGRGFGRGPTDSEFSPGEGSEEGSIRSV